MPSICSLNMLRQGDEATVCSLTTDGAMRRRLMDIGFMPGTPVRSLFTSSCGEPTAYLIQGAVIALRSEDASTVIVDTGL